MRTKKYVRDMDMNEIRTLIEENDTIRDALFNRAWDNAWYWCDTYLKGFKGRYELGGQYDYLTIDEDTYSMTYSTFATWFNNVQKDYCLVSDRDEKTIQDFLHYAEIDYKLTYEVDTKQKDAEYVSNRVNELKEESERILLDRLKSEYDACYDTDVLIDEFDCMDDYEDAFIIDDDYSTLYRHVNGYYTAAHDEIVA